MIKKKNLKLKLKNSLIVKKALKLKKASKWTNLMKMIKTKKMKRNQVKALKVIKKTQSTITKMILYLKTY